MTAFQAGVGFDLQLVVMVASHFIARERQVVILVDYAYIYSRRARLAVVAIHTISDTADSGVNCPISE